MSIALITGSAGLIGSEAATYFGKLGLDVVGIDNDMRKTFFGEEASTRWNVQRVSDELGGRYRHYDIDIRDREAIMRLFGEYGSDIAVIIHTAAQPSHDWAAKEPFTDFDINAVGTLNLLEATRHHAPNKHLVGRSKYLLVQIPLYLRMSKLQATSYRQYYIKPRS